jgi:hypothetical protein
MKYFTPQLYQQFNSFDVAEAERADEAWDVAEMAYKERLNSIKKQLPLQIVELSEICLHDADVLLRGERAEPTIGVDFFGVARPYPLPLWASLATILAKLDNELVCLFYCLADHLKTTPAPEGWRFSKEQEQWLYDEVDVEMTDKWPFIPFVHRILFSTGIVLEIRFVSVIVQKAKLPVVAKIAKHSA